MFFNNRYTHLEILLINLVVGVGLAFAIPWLANTQCKASEDIPTISPDSWLGKSSNRYDSPYFESNGSVTIPIPIACWATHNNGVNVFTAIIGSSSVQQAVDAASPGDTVKVAGTCRGGESRAGLTQTVYISKPLTLQGGYRNGAWNQDPDPTNFTTTLYAAYNVARVVVVSGTQDVTLDSLTLKGGLANDGTLGNNGGGVWSNSEMTLTNLTIYSNKAQNGAGMYNKYTSPILINVTFTNNIANNKGGAMFNYGWKGGSIPTLMNVTFTDNEAHDGGAIYNYGYQGTSSPILTNVIFSGNEAKYKGGAMFTEISGSGKINPILTNVTFIDNKAMYGGAIYNYSVADGDSSPVLTNVIFSGNKAECGGAMYNIAVYSGNINPKLTNGIISGNKAEYGGAMYNYCGYTGKSNPKLTNVTFSGNSAVTSGGALYNRSDDGGECKPNVRNSIFWNNQDYSGNGTITANIYNKDASIFLMYSLLQNSFPNGSWVGGSYEDGGGNIDTNPMFLEPIDPSNAPTSEGNLRLQSGSPAINAGINAFVTEPKDLDGNDRILDGVVDMGAYETMPISLLPLIFR